ncbi:hypothetical protein HHI36_001825 [Cryptolaemus montrouzieri]|uniref:Uncharacterized protein n=1 Tax=Cryptolaemus montrouzieri TaxID=559131 RepID=A0ABD2P9D5_9CUCU
MIAKPLDLELKFRYNNNNAKDLWKYVKKLREDSTTSPGVDEMKMEDGTSVTKRHEVAEYFATYSSDIGKNLAAKITKPSSRVLVQRRNMKSKPIETTQEVKALINSLKGGKSAGIDGLKSEISKIVSDFILKPLVYYQWVWK